MRDKDFFSYLLSNGIRTGRKSYSLKPPIRCDPLWYIVGFIDGDGWVEQVERKLLFNESIFTYASLPARDHGRETPGLHAGYNGGDSGIRTRKGEVIPQTPP